MGSQRHVPACDRGASLIEVVVSVVLIGVAGIAVLSALAATTVGARTHSQVATAQAGLASVGDVLTGPGSAWWACTTPDLVARYQQEVDDRFGDAYDVTLTGVEFWNGTAFGSTCAAASGHRLQRLTLVAHPSDGQRTFTVIKRPPVSVVPTAGTVPVAVGWESTLAWNQGVPTPTTTTTTTTTTTSTTTTATTTTTTTTTAPGPTTTTTTTTTTGPGPTTTTTTTTTTAPGPTTTPATSTTTPATSTTMPPASAVTCQFTVAEAWGAGGNGNLTITNGKSQAISSWQVRITLGSYGLSLWNANTSVSGGKLTAANLAWNGSVPAGSTATPTGGSVSGSSITVGLTLPCEVISS